MVAKSVFSSPEGFVFEYQPLQTYLLPIWSGERVVERWQSISVGLPLPVFGWCPALFGFMSPDVSRLIVRSLY